MNTGRMISRMTSTKSFGLSSSFFRSSSCSGVRLGAGVVVVVGFGRGLEAPPKKRFTKLMRLPGMRGAADSGAGESTLSMALVEGLSTAPPEGVKVNVTSRIGNLKRFTGLLFNQGLMEIWINKQCRLRDFFFLKVNSTKRGWDIVFRK